MKNYEKYADEIRRNDGNNFCNNFVIPVIHKGCECLRSCEQCRMLQTIWLLEDYEEPETDWSKVEVDTPILVRSTKNEEWSKRYFAKYENGDVHAWIGGCTSWSEENASAWKYAKLAESEEE